MAQNFGNKLLGSIGWLFIGILVFLGSFVVLFFTEGRTDYSLIAQQSKALSESIDGDFIYVEGELTSPELLGDDIYLYEDKYIAFERTVEMFSWVEEKHTENEDTYYTYDTKWIEKVPNSTNFDDPRRHENPQKELESMKEVVSTAFVEDYEINTQKVRFPGKHALKLNEETVDISGYTEKVSDEDTEYLFDGYGTYVDPEIGDLRISYSVLDAGNDTTVFGKFKNNGVFAHSGEQENKLYRIFNGTKDDALVTLRGEYKTSGWIGRIGTFVLMWVGLLLLLKPLSVAMELIPIIGGLGKGALGVITFVVALILTFVASVLFQIFNSITGLIFLAVVVIGVVLYLNTTKQEKSTQGPGSHPPTPPHPKK